MSKTKKRTPRYSALSLVCTLFLLLPNTSSGQLDAMHLSPFELSDQESASSSVPNGNLIEMAKTISQLNDNWNWGWTTWSGSMRPVIDGNTIFIGETNVYDDLGVGDLISYRSYLPGRGYVLHRIVAQYGDAWIVKGDNNFVQDLEMVTRNNFDMRVFIIMTSSEEPPLWVDTEEHDGRSRHVAKNE